MDLMDHAPLRTGGTMPVNQGTVRVGEGGTMLMGGGDASPGGTMQLVGGAEGDGTPKWKNDEWEAKLIGRRCVRA